MGLSDAELASRISTSVLEIETRNATAILRLNRPPINALDETALRELAQAVDRVEETEVIRVVIFASANDSFFWPGGDRKY